MIPDRDTAWSFLTEHMKSDSLIKHSLAVEAVMRHFAEKLGHDPDKWGVIGLIHDFDYEQYPEDHCVKGAVIMNERGWPEEYIRGMQAHGWGICTDVEPQHEMEKVLYGCDELTGLITAAVLMRPSRSVMDIEVKSVKKKWKDKRFAAGADRSIIQKGIEMLGWERDDFIRETILGMRTAAEVIGLAG